MLSTYQALAPSPTLAAKHTTALGVLESLFLQMGKLKLKEIGLRSHSSERHRELDPAHLQSRPFSLDQHFPRHVL